MAVERCGLSNTKKPTFVSGTLCVNELASRRGDWTPLELFALETATWPAELVHAMPFTNEAAMNSFVDYRLGRGSDAGRSVRPSDVGQGEDPPMNHLD